MTLGFCSISAAVPSARIDPWCITVIVLQIRRMAHRTPIFSYSIIACAAGGPTVFLMASLFWLLAAFRPERDPQLILLFNDMAWVTFSSQVPNTKLLTSILHAFGIASTGLGKYPGDIDSSLTT